MPKPEELLACALTYRDATRRDAPVPQTFETIEEATQTWTNVLLHEAHEALSAPLQHPPPDLYLHPIDVDTTDPGIVDRRDGSHILRCPPDMPRILYAPSLQATPFVSARPRPAVTPQEATERAAAQLQKHIAKEEKKAATQERRAQRAAQQKEDRANETPEERAQRLAAAKEKRANAPKREKKKEAPVKAPPTDDSLLEADASTANALASLRPRRKGKSHVFEHPLPHHRHLLGAQTSDPSAPLQGALLRGEASDALEIIQGPPGTGKTRELVARARGDARRLLLCAPTNVGAANLYRRCLEDGLGDEAALVMAPDRVPAGTPVGSADPARRVICATISARSGALMDESFDAVFVDEAAQCMEAWVWTLLRAETRRLVLAGDVRQLPALVSESGRAFAHDRSLMQRLVELGYANVTSLTEQHRMAPELLRLPNERFYDGALRCGSAAPEHGVFEIVRVAGAEERVGTSFRNAAEADAVIAAAEEGAVLLTPYAAQVQLLLSKGSGHEVHTVDAFQGREADTIVLSFVRDGRDGLGFWEDARRLNVALTRARTRLVIVMSCDFAM